MKKTYICLEPGEHHPALCVVVKHSEIEGRLNPTVKMKYDVHSIEALPAGMSHIDMHEKIKSCMKRFIIGDIRVVLGYTYISDATARFFEGTSLKPAKITITGDQEPYREGFMLYVPYKKMLEQIDELKSQNALKFTSEASESGFVEDDDCDLALGMAVWFASNDTEQYKGKNIPGYL